MVRYGEKQDGRVTRAQRARAERRTAVLAAARRIFADKGYHATSIDDIIEAADIARGTFYLYFESKRAIFDELLDELFTTLASTVKRIEVGPGARPPVEQMDATVDRVMQTLVENREMARILLREAVGIDDEFDAKLAQFYGRIEALIVSAVQTGQQMSLVRALRSRARGARHPRRRQGARPLGVRQAGPDAAGPRAPGPRAHRLHAKGPVRLRP